METNLNESLVSFLDRLASGEPAPGGGAASALAAAAAAALVAMACRVTARHTPSEAIVAASESAETLRQQLVTLMREDVNAYQAVLESRRAPADRRASLRQSAMQRATSVPLATARAAAEILDLCAAICDVVRVSTVGDLGVAAALAGAALDAASVTVRINLGEIADKDFVRAVWQGLHHLEPAAAVRAALARRIARRAGLDRPDAGTFP